MSYLLADTGALYAIADRSDTWHPRLKRFLKTCKDVLLVPVTVLPEICTLLNTRLGPFAERRFLLSCHQGELSVESLQREDFSRALQILDRMTGANVGFVDASVAAMAERLKIERILTTDRQHFSLFRPRHCKAFTLLP